MRNAGRYEKTNKLKMYDVDDAVTGETYFRIFQETHYKSGLQTARSKRAEKGGIIVKTVFLTQVRAAHSSQYIRTIILTWKAP